MTIAALGIAAPVVILALFAPNNRLGYVHFPLYLKLKLTDPSAMATTSCKTGQQTPQPQKKQKTKTKNQKKHSDIYIYHYPKLQAHPRETYDTNIQTNIIIINYNTKLPQLSPILASLNRPQRPQNKLYRLVHLLIMRNHGRDVLTRHLLLNRLLIHIPLVIKTLHQRRDNGLDAHFVEVVGLFTN